MGRGKLGCDVHCDFEVGLLTWVGGYNVEEMIRWRLLVFNIGFVNIIVLY